MTTTKKTTKTKPKQVKLTRECGHAKAIVRNCPYSEDVNGDSDQRCRCCDACAGECAADI